MRKAFWTVIIILGIWSCKSQSSKKEGDSITYPLKAEMVAENQSTVLIKDSALYDKTFIAGLAGYKEPIQLIGNYIIAENDTTWFPEDLPLNKTVVFKATQDHKKYMLSVSRNSLTNLSYAFQLTGEKDKMIDSKSGNAVLGSLFFLASEMDKDSQTGKGYGSYEYWDKSNDCWFAVRIGHGNAPHGKQRAMITYGCEDKNKQALTLNECPTLRTE